MLKVPNFHKERVQNNGGTNYVQDSVLQLTKLVNTR